VGLQPPDMLGRDRSVSAPLLSRRAGLRARFASLRIQHRPDRQILKTRGWVWDGWVGSSLVIELALL